MKLKKMAEYKAEEILVIEPGAECVTKSKPFNLKSKLNEALPGIKKIVIGKNIVDIGESAFAGCTSLTEAAIPKNVTRIGGGKT